LTPRSNVRSMHVTLLRRSFTGIRIWPQHTTFFAKPENAQKLTPEEAELMRLHATYQQNARAYTKQRRKIGIQH
jgi:hypothetical protein